MNQVPTVEELNNSQEYQLLATVEHSRIKDFVLDQVMEDRRFIPFYMVYQTILFLGALFFLSRSVVLAVRGDLSYLLVSLGSVAFSLTFLVVIHELLHGLVLKLAGAPRINFGVVPGKFIFYAEADHFVMGKRAFLWVAFTPLVFIQGITLVLIILWYAQPLVFFPLMVMCIHSFFCAGDVALATLFYRFPGQDVYTYDNRKEKASFYYLRRRSVDF